MSENAPEKLPLRVVVINLKDECLRWLKIEWRFHFSWGLLALAFSFWWSLHTNQAHWFGRGGALLSLAGGLMTFRRYLRGEDIEWMVLSGRARTQPFKQHHPFWSKEVTERHDHRAMGWGLLFVIAGTLVWGYGDLWIAHFLFPALTN